MPFKVFYDRVKNFHRFEENLYQKIKEEIISEPDDYILNVGEGGYVEVLKQKYSWDFPNINFEGKFLDADSHKKILLCIPFSGDIDLMSYFPTAWNSGGVNVRVEVEGNFLLYDVTKFPPLQRTTYIDNYVEILSDNYQYLKNDFDDVLLRLDSKITSIFRSHRQIILSQRNALAQTGIPIRRREDSASFAIPRPDMRKKIEVKPQVAVKGYQPEPAVDDETYVDILKTVNDAGKMFERAPSVYAGKEEEHLRDHILVVLSPTFQVGTSTGESFNKSGKTDILLSYQNTTAFVAECKFWRGAESYLKTIDQLLGYLTWRNSKTSIVVFVNNISMTHVLNQISTLTATHPNFVKEDPKQDESWFNFTMHLPDDPNKEIKMAVQLFHIPPI